MEAGSPGKNVTLIAGAIGGISLGWMLKTYISRKQSLEEYESVWQRLKNFEQKVYEDGMKRAYQIEHIKNEVQQKLN